MKAGGDGAEARREGADGKSDQTENRDDPAVVDAGRSFAVIGAGAAGLCAAKYLIQSGFDNVSIFELGTQIGGLWCYENDNGRSSCYRTESDTWRHIGRQRPRR